MAGREQNASTGPRRLFGQLPRHAASRLSMRAALESQDDLATTLLSVRSDSRGLTEEQASRRRTRRGANRMTIPSQRRRRTVMRASLSDLQSLSLLLLTLVAVLTDAANLPGAVAVLLLVALTAVGALVRNRQNHRTILALNELTSTSSPVLRRRSADDEPQWRTVPSSELVSGDIVQLAAGIRVPADVRLIEANELYVDQSVLTGDVTAVRKFVGGPEGSVARERSKRFDPPSLPNISLTGCFVLSGTGTGVVVATGEQTYFGSLARALLQDNGHAWQVQFGAQWYLPRLLLLVPVAALFRAGYAHGPAWQLGVLTLAAALYLLPELLPGLFLPKAVRPEGERGALSSLATWLQQLRGQGEGRPERFADADVALIEYLDAGGRTSINTLRRAWVLSRLNSASRTSVDTAVLQLVEEHPKLNMQEDAQILDEIPFDLRRQRYSLIVAGRDGQQMLICRGGFEAVIAVAVNMRVGNEVVPLDSDALERLQRLIRAQLHQGYFVQLIGCRFIPPNQAKRLYSRADEQNLTIEGLLVLRADVGGSRQAAE